MFSQRKQLVYLQQASSISYRQVFLSNEVRKEHNNSFQIQGSVAPEEQESHRFSTKPEIMDVNNDDSRPQRKIIPENSSLPILS